MRRFLIAGALVLAASSPALAQDMPLSQILIDGEGWKKVEGNPVKPQRANPSEVIGPNGDRPAPLAAVRSASGDTIYVSYQSSPYLRAYVADVKGVVGKGARYCELRTRRGGSFPPFSLAADKDGRIYAATDIGVQVFDPTGRLCGVVALPTGDSPDLLAFEGDKLTLWSGNDKYARKLRTEGAK